METKRVESRGEGRGGAPTRRACHIVAAAITLCSAAPLTADAGMGDLDPAFGSDGLVHVFDNAGPNVLELPDGRILIIGSPTGEVPSRDAGREVAINRYLASGAPDLAFGNGGRVTVVLPVDGPSISAVARQADGKIVMAGTYLSKYGYLPFIARVDSNGALDRAFGSGGVAESRDGATEPYYSSVAALSNGDILATISDWGSDRIDHFDADGRPLGDLLRADFAPARLAHQSDGRLIVSGYDRTRHLQGVIRLAADGHVDTTFGDDGFAALEASYTRNLAIEPGTDRIVLCGPGVVRLTSDGRLDTTFGLQGTGYVGFGSDSVPAFDFCHRILAMWDGGLVFVGIRKGQTPLGSDQAVAVGLTNSGTADLRFGSGSGASEVGIQGMYATTEWWDDNSSALVRTHDGDAVVTWATEYGLKLARLDLNAGSGEDTPWPPPPMSSAPLPLPSPGPSPASQSEADGGSGGGGSLAWLDLALIAVGAGSASLRRRKA